MAKAPLSKLTLAATSQPETRARIRIHPAAVRSSQPVPRALRLHGTVARELGIRIVSGDIAPGELLDGEIEASERFRVSRTAYREAIRILAAKGLVQSRPKIGTHVSPRHEWHLLDPDVLGWMFESEPDPVLIEHLFELRRIVEPDAARLAALRRSEEQLARMQAGLNGMAEHGFATEAGRRADQEFHAALLDASHNDFVISLTTGVATAIALTTAFKQRRLPAPHDALPEHVRVYQAVAAGDAQGAHDAMANLVDRGRSDTIEARQALRAREDRG